MLVGRLTSSVISGKVSTRTQLIAVSTTAILFTLIAIFTPKNVGINVPTMVYDPVAKTTEILTNAACLPMKSAHLSPTRLKKAFPHRQSC